jgi:ArsR family transcriptional regulator, virulence genes transcriptional regulator
MKSPPAQVKDNSMARFAAKAEQAANLLKELANEKRLLILCTLIDAREMSVAELADAVGLGQSALSQHLSRMREADVINFRRDGTTLLYSVANGDVGRILKTLKSIYC